MSSTWNNYSVGASDDAGGPQVINEEKPACGSCRKRKLKCSREHPVCSHCARLEIGCVYEAKQKPGLKVGAVEGLTRRVEFLEQILLDANGKVRSLFDPGDDIRTVGQEPSPSARHDQPISAAPSFCPTDLQPSENCVPVPDRQRSPLRAEECHTNTRKRKRNQQPLAESLLDLELDEIFDYLPPQPLLLKLVDYFCVTFHHWIPYLHKQRLRNKVVNLSKDPQQCLVLHALVAATLRHLDRTVSFMDTDQIASQTRISRFIAETFSIRDVSLEGLRAIIIIVFDYLNNGQFRKAWPLIGSLTRTVDYLQLTVEPTAAPFGALMHPLKLVAPTDDITELEERRRLFWVIFLLDRFCSVSTGWNTSLTSEDVHRRLPADGGYFTREEPVTTPYFGIWNKSSAKIGKSLAHVPAQYNEDDPIVEQVQGTSPASANSTIDASKLGAFAYCIEATESLNQVTTFFLQQRINWQDKEHAVSWLTRFKELDLRLVHWKLFLPPRWKDSNISPVTEVVDMDPNLTLAHITHNTSMILLHHPIAYPPTGWNNYVALPKECSAQTCELAAVEACNIVDKFLTHRVVFVNVQFAFCVFVAAKALLFESHATKKPARHEFRMLLRSLWELSARWGAAAVSSHDNDRGDTNQAGIYARRLEHLHDTCQHDAHFRFDLYDHFGQEQAPQRQTLTSPRRISTPLLSGLPYVQELHGPSNKHYPPSTSRPNTPHFANILHNNSVLSPSSSSSTFAHYSQQQTSSPESGFPKSSQMGPPGLYPPHARTNSLDQSSGHRIYTSANLSSAGSHILQPQPGQPQNTVQDENLLSLSDAFMDSQFQGMDRVITFEDANFFLPGDGFRWQ